MTSLTVYGVLSSQGWYLATKFSPNQHKLPTSPGDQHFQKTAASPWLYTFARDQCGLEQNNYSESPKYYKTRDRMQTLH